MLAAAALLLFGHTHRYVLWYLPPPHSDTTVYMVVPATTATLSLLGYHTGHQATLLLWHCSLPTAVTAAAAAL
ncbi:hypothetical protein DFH07DRAFT_968486 [Mycena maculata]|uniref:Uncharacterized protein n=1 Tax=Mycena maculata TaxID=230809 RepID=A0AAD7I0D5_9AGAR|nr:hypothetical protein DFH07DRAFT_968486 [Mycena maculata]